MDCAKRVVLGMSGGVDSSISAVILQREGFEVIGVTCLFQRSDVTLQAIEDARETCRCLGIEHRVYNCVDAFEQEVVVPFLESYALGLTPSPCVGCNAYMKIPTLIKAADELGCDLVSTGHYARINQMKDTGRYAVLCALDYHKDQSYMLSALSQDQLERFVLPLGGLTKPEVRSIATDLGLDVAQKPESQDICFAPQGYRVLLRERNINGKPGDIVNTQGEVVGRHDGLINYTLGQRHGIGVSGCEPYYVVDLRPIENELVIGTLEESRIKKVQVSYINWQAIERPFEPLEATVKLRYRSEACPCIIEPNGIDCAQVKLQSLQPTTAPGQYAVFYQGAVVLGGGIIEEVGL